MPRSMDETRQYINTMVFAIVSGVVSVVLLMMVLSGSAGVQKYTAFIITLEVGLVAVIVSAIWRIVSFESRRKKFAQNGYENKLTVSSCPDYWTSSGKTCMNSYVDPNDKKVTYFIDGTAKSSPSSLDRSISRDDFDGKKIPDVCKAVRNTVKAPWTDVTSVCDSYRISAFS